MKEPKVDGERLRALRKERGLSVPELADKSGVSARTIYFLEAKQRPQTAAVTLARVAQALCTSVDDLVGLTDR
jgi:transcriptional regulator with XRE-family HTH domain